jgi:hypothetical protein
MLGELLPKMSAKDLIPKDNVKLIPEIMSSLVPKVDFFLDKWYPITK